MKVVLLILGAILIVLSLILMLAQPIIGVLGIIFGVVLIIASRKKKKEEPKEEFVIPDVHTFLVAGFDHYQEELASLMKEKNQTEETGRVYEYEIEWLDAELKDEPENEFDPNAIAVYALEKDYLESKAVKIGYVRKKDQDEVNRLRPCKSEVEIYGGKYTEDGEQGETPYKANLYLESR